MLTNGSRHFSIKLSCQFHHQLLCTLSPDFPSFIDFFPDFLSTFSSCLPVWFSYFIPFSYLCRINDSPNMIKKRKKSPNFCAYPGFIDTTIDQWTPLKVAAARRARIKDIGLAITVTAIQHVGQIFLLFSFFQDQNNGIQRLLMVDFLIPHEGDASICGFWS